MKTRTVRQLLKAQSSGIDELTSLARGLGQDEAAIRAGLTLSYSQGPVEGAINRLKYLKVWPSQF